MTKIASLIKMVSQKARPNSVTTSANTTKKSSSKNFFANITKLIMHLTGSLTIITQMCNKPTGRKSRPNGISINPAVKTTLK